MDEPCDLESATLNELMVHAGDRVQRMVVVFLPHADDMQPVQEPFPLNAVCYGGKWATDFTALPRPLQESIFNLTMCLKGEGDASTP